MGLKPAGKIVLLLIVAGGAYGGYRLWSGKGSLLDKLAPEKQLQGSKVPPRADLPPAAAATDPVVQAKYPMPSSEPVSGGKPPIRFLIWAWNAQMGGLFANGGAQTTAGSFMAKEGVNVNFVRQDDPVKMQEELVAFATDLSRGNPQPTVGSHFVAIMGDGGASFLDGLNKQLKRLGPEYTAKVVGSMGYSRGEDKFMGPKAWKDNPAACKGGVVAGYLRDGDWNIALKWLGDNGLRNNPDEKTWDPDALNWVAADSYIDAAEKYIAGYSEDRPVVKNGVKTGETKHITVQGVVTWTPGDVSVARKKGGIVSIVSTKEYSSQMPNVIIGIDKWMKSNRSTVESMLSAFFKGADAVRANPLALTHAAKISNEVYSEPDTGPEYWERYYKGIVERDATGTDVELGGSAVNNLADNMYLFGMFPGSANLFAATYTVFGDIVKDQYPDLLPSYPPVGDILDTSYVKTIAARMAPTTKEVEVAKPQPVKPTEAEKPITPVATETFRIQFATGKADFTPAAKAQLERILNKALIAGSLTIEIQGHTDNTGSPDKNMQLSEARAFAVKKWLETRAPANFPSGKIRVRAFGQTAPAVPNTTEEGRAQNRRVVVVMGTTK